MAHDIEESEEKINQLNRVFLIWQSCHWNLVHHNPGWTMLPEFMLVEASIDSLRKQTGNVTEHCQCLLKAAETIGTHS